MKKNEMFEKIEKLYFNKTFNEVSTQDIADLFGINKASLYYYFKSKEILFSELIEYSFNNFKNNLEDILKNDLDSFIKNYLIYPSDSQNLFAVINQDGVCKKEVFLENIKGKQKDIFDILYNYFNTRYSFSMERTFILFSLLDSLSRKQCIKGGCFIELDSLLIEIKSLFIK